MRLFFIFGYIFLEVYSLMLLADGIGGLLTVLWVFAAAGLGFWIIRETGRENFQRMMMGMQTGDSPQQSLLNSFFIIFAGVLLISPGVFSDCIALLFLIPHVRRLFFGRTARFVESKGQQFYSGNTTFFQFFGTPGASDPQGREGFYQQQGNPANGHQAENTNYMDAEYVVREQTPRKTTAVIIESEALHTSTGDDLSSSDASARKSNDPANNDSANPSAGSSD